MDEYLANADKISELVKTLEEKNMVSVAIASSMLTRQSLAYISKEVNTQWDLPMARLRLKNYMAYRDDQVSELTRK